jgi:hypothetical protein
MAIWASIPSASKNREEAQRRLDLVAGKMFLPWAFAAFMMLMMGMLMTSP